MFSLLSLAHSAGLQLRLKWCMCVYRIVRRLKASIKYFTSSILIHLTGTVLCYDAKQGFKN